MRIFRNIVLHELLKTPIIQNEIFNIIGYDILQADLINEQLPIYISFVDKNYKVREEFLEFGRCEQLNGEVLYNY